MFNDQNDAVFHSAYPEVDPAPGPMGSSGLETPQSSPLLADQDSFDGAGFEGASLALNRDADVQSEEVRVPSWRSIAPCLRVRLQVEALRRELVRRAEELRQLRDERDALETERDELRMSVASEKSRLSVIEGSYASLQLASERLQSEVLTLTQHSGTLAEELRSVQDKYQVSQVKLSTSEASISKLTVELECSGTAVASLREELTDTRTELESARTDRAIATARIRAVEEDLEDTRGRASILAASNVDLEHTVTTLQETIERLSAEFSQAQGEISSMATQVRESQDVIRDLRASEADALARASASAREAASMKTAVADIQSALEVARSQLQTAAGEKTALRARVEEEEASRRKAESELVTTQDARDRLVTEIAERTRELATTAAALEQARGEAGERRREIAGLEREREKEVASHVVEMATLSKDLATARAQNEARAAELVRVWSDLTSTSEKLDAAAAEREELSGSLGDALLRASELEEELRVALNDVRDAEEEIEELRLAKAEDEASILSLKDAYARLRQVQLSVLDEVGDKVRGKVLSFRSRKEAYDIYCLDDLCEHCSHPWPSPPEQCRSASERNCRTGGW